MFKRVVRSVNAPDPKCPKRSCQVVYHDIGLDMAGPPPAIGGSNIAKAVDTTAEMVMQDHKMTDLRDGTRQGEISAPKLKPELQNQVDNFFSGGGQQRQRSWGFNAQSLGRQALAGNLRSSVTPDVLGTIHKEKYRPPVRIVAGDKG